MKTALMVLLATLGLFATPANAVDDPGWRPVELPQASQRDIQSERTGKVYRIFVSEPRHEPPPGGYPVLYVLDGNALFPSLAIQAQALENRPGPTLRNSMLVVGIGYPGNELYDFEARSDDYTPKAEDRQRLPNRESAPSGGADDFLAFIEDELKPMIALRYSVNSQRQTLFGHSYGVCSRFTPCSPGRERFRAMLPPARQSGGTRTLSTAHSTHSNARPITSPSMPGCWSLPAVPSSPQRMPP